MFTKFFVIFFLAIASMATSDVSEYFPEKNASQITWAHAVNNKTLLQEALNSNVNMLEADISLGKLSPDDVDDIPIMAHPPATISDLSLQNFLILVHQHNTNHSDNHKGVKLDFKTIEAFDKSISILKENIEGTKPLWLNADILPGPVNSTAIPVNAENFLTLSNTEFKNITLSVGWTTNFNNSYDGEGYSEEQITDMIETLMSFQNKLPVTFPVRAGLAANSLVEMKNLIENVTDSTLTIWSSDGDPVNVNKLKNLIFDLGLDKVFIDVPKKLRDQLGLPSAGNEPGSLGFLPIMILSIIILILSTVL